MKSIEVMKREKDLLVKKDIIVGINTKDGPEREVLIKMLTNLCMKEIQTEIETLDELERDKCDE